MAKPTIKKKFFILNNSLGLGGTENISYNFLKFLKDYDCKLIVLNNKKNFFDKFSDSKKIINLNLNRARYSIFSLIRIFNKEKPNYIFSNQRETNIALCVSKFFFRFKAITIIREAAPLTFEDSNKISIFLKVFFLKIIYRYCDGVIFNSEYTKKSFMDKGFLIKNNKVINNPLLVKENKINYSKNKKKIFITCSRLDKQKNLFELIKIFQKYSIRNKEAELFIVGSGNLYEEIKLEVEKIKYKKKIKVFKALIEIEKYYKISNMYISTSKSEGFGNTFIEALSYNLPIISKDNGGIKDIIKKNNQGLIIKNDNYLNFIASINFLLKKNFSLLRPSVNKFKKEYIFKKYLDFISSCRS